MFRNFVLWIVLLLILIIVNMMIIQKERILDKGETVFLKLAPVDPRSIMQGDYMALEYDIVRKIRYDKNLKDKGCIVISIDKNKVASFKKFYNPDQALGEKELKLQYIKIKNGVQIISKSYLFQEGTGKYYNNAKYGMIKLTKEGKALLTGLCTENLKKILPPKMK